MSLDVASRHEYQASGKWSPAGAAIAVVVAVVGSLVLGFVYGVVLYYMPLIYLSFLLTCGAAIGAGMAAQFGARFGSIRNGGVATLVGAVAGVVTLWASWVAWAWATTEWEWLPLHPLELREFIDIVAQEGMWSIFGQTPTGGVLIGIWSIEALMVIGGGLLLGATFLTSTPYCERCEAWVDDETEIGPLAPTKAADAAEALAQGDLRPTLALEAARLKASRYAKLVVKACGGCHDVTVLSLVLVTIEQKGDKTETDEDELVENVLVPAAGRAEIVKFANRIAEGPQREPKGPASPPEE